MRKEIHDVIEFWFNTTKPEQRFAKDFAFDEEVRKNFLDTYWTVIRGEHSEWRNTPEGRLAEIIVLDQFARNMFRGKAQAFMYDPLALALAQEMIRTGDDQKLDTEKRHFAYMPFMHSESKKIHEAALGLFEGLGGDAMEYEIKHKKVIDTFGRYPHRNEILGRISTSEELDFIKTYPGF